MRVMQLIDTLELGGAERMAVSYANMLSTEIEASFLCATRAEGPLKSSILPEVSYCFLDRKKTLDWKAVQRIVAFVKKENIHVIHAHGTSYFFAYLIKLKYRSIKLIWHNHHGASSNYGIVKRLIIKNFLQSFDGVIAVNDQLKNWVIDVLRYPREQSYYLSNFVDFTIKNDSSIDTLIGLESQRVVCLANLKHPKGHLFLTQAFDKIKTNFPKATLHFVGADYKDAYSDRIKSFIEEHHLEKTIFLHGKKSNSSQYLNACAIGVIASSSEGLPMALLEYGRANLAVITTDVGQCARVVQEYGIMVPSGDLNAMSGALERLLQNDQEKTTLTKEFSNHIKTNFSQEVVKGEILKIYRTING